MFKYVFWFLLFFNGDFLTTAPLATAMPLHKRRDREAVPVTAADMFSPADIQTILSSGWMSNNTSAGLSLNFTPFPCPSWPCRESTHSVQTLMLYPRAKWLSVWSQMKGPACRGRVHVVLYKTQCEELGHAERSTVELASDRLRFQLIFHFTLAYNLTK